MVVSRRGLLLGGAAASIVLTGGLAWELTPAPGALVLSEHELRVVRALAEVMFPGAPFRRILLIHVRPGARGRGAAADEAGDRECRKKPKVLLHQRSPPLFLRRGNYLVIA